MAPRKGYGSYTTDTMDLGDIHQHILDLLDALENPKKKGVPPKTFDADLDTGAYFQSTFYYYSTNNNKFMRVFEDENDVVLTGSAVDQYSTDISFKNMALHANTNNLYVFLHGEESPRLISCTRHDREDPDDVTFSISPMLKKMKKPEAPENPHNDPPAGKPNALVRFLHWVNNSWFQDTIENYQREEEDWKERCRDYDMLVKPRYDDLCYAVERYEKQGKEMESNHKTTRERIRRDKEEKIGKKKPALGKDLKEKLDKAFEAAEKKCQDNKTRLSRADFIICNGSPLSTRMLEVFNADKDNLTAKYGDSQGFIHSEEGKKALEDLIAREVKMGSRLEYFAPDKDLKIPEKPVTLFAGESLDGKWAAPASKQRNTMVTYADNLSTAVNNNIQRNLAAGRSMDQQPIEMAQGGLNL